MQSEERPMTGPAGAKPAARGSAMHEGGPVGGPVGDAVGDAVGQLVVRCAAGDRAALRILYETEAPMMLGIAVRILGDRRLGEEAVQDCLVQVWRNADQFDPTLGSGRSWIIGILRFRAIDLREAELRRTPANRIDVETADASGDLSPAEPPAIDDRMALSHCLGQLMDGPRASITMAYIEGCSHAEIAERLDKPLGTVKSWILRGLASLRECLEQ